MSDNINILGKEMNWLEKQSIVLKPMPGNCKKSTFKNGYHRIGLIERFCPLDGGIKGASAEWICVDCGEQVDKDGQFILCHNSEYPIRGSL